MDPEKYISQAIPAYQDKLNTLRNLVHGSDTRVQEQMRGDFIYFTINSVDFCALKAQKNYVSLYVLKHSILDSYKDQLKGLNHGVCCIRFTKTKIVPETLLSEILYKSAQTFD